MKLLDGQNIGLENMGIYGRVEGGEETDIVHEEAELRQLEKTKQMVERGIAGSTREGENLDFEFNREITFTEVEKGVDRLKKGKTVGEDGIPIEFMK